MHLHVSSHVCVWGREVSIFPDEKLFNHDYGVIESENIWKVEYKDYWLNTVTVGTKN